MKKLILLTLSVFVFISVSAQNSLEAIKGTYVGELHGGAVSQIGSQMKKSEGIIEISDNGLTIKNFNSLSLSFKPFVLSPVEVKPVDKGVVLVNKDWHISMETSDGKYLLQSAIVSLDALDLYRHVQGDDMLLYFEVQLGNGGKLYGIFRGRKQAVTGIAGVKTNLKAGVAYDLSGRPVRSNHKGICITNGKKMMR